MSRRRITWYTYTERSSGTFTNEKAFRIANRMVYLPVWWGGLGDTSLSLGRLSNCSKDGTPPPPSGG